MRAARAGATPIFFGDRGAPMFGWFHPGADAERRPLAIVLVPPIGFELMSSHEAFRILAERLARAGFSVLRFELPGTGDSAGGDEDADRVSAWQAGIASAIAELRAASGRSAVGIVGLRLGATLALSVAGGADVDDLVLWWPCRSGKQYVREARALRMMEVKYDDARRDAPVFDAEGADEEVVGFRFSGETLRDLSALDPAAASGRPAARLLLISRADLSPEAKLAALLRTRGGHVEETSLPGYAQMMAAPHRSVAPEAALQRIVDWFSARHPAAEDAAVGASTGSERAEIATPGGVRVEERALCFGEGGRLFGVIARPLASAPFRPRAAVLFVNTALHNRTGAHRVYVPLARAWAARGLPSLRMDVGGVGDSPRPPGRSGVAIYSMDTIEDVERALELLADEGLSRVVVVGMCSGAYTAFHAARAGARVEGVVMINPQTLRFREGDSLDVVTAPRLTQTPRRGASPRALWKKLRERGARELSDRLVRRLAGVARHRAKIIWQRLSGAPETRSGAELEALVKQRVNVFLLFTTGDPGLDSLRAHAAGALRRLRGRPGFSLTVIDGPDHTFTEVREQRRLADALTAHLERLGFFPEINAAG